MDRGVIKNIPLPTTHRPPYASCTLSCNFSLMKAPLPSLMLLAASPTRPYSTSPPLWSPGSLSPVNPAPPPLSPGSLKEHKEKEHKGTGPLSLFTGPCSDGSLIREGAGGLCPKPDGEAREADVRRRDGERLANLSEGSVWGRVRPPISNPVIAGNVDLLRRQGRRHRGQRERQGRRQYGEA